MGLIRVQSSAVMDAPTSAVYEVLADYQDSHPAILPRKHFIDMTVEEGGRGAGTVIRLRMKLMGRERSSRMTVTEPDPGKVLMEADAEAG
ncbi:MAG: SRPBCC family protein, partial [Dehalococcoidia bacterium]